MIAAEQVDFTRAGDWARDAKHTLFVLSRYKFVAKMLEGHPAVLEAGCGEAVASRIVRQHVGTLVCVDSRADLIDAAIKRERPVWGREYMVHDMVRDGRVEMVDAVTKAHTFATFQSAYALDVLEHIPAEHEDAFLENLKASVSDVVILGSPSLESQVYASENSKAGHLNCKTAADLRAVMRKHFRTVFMFGMNDEVVHTGFAAMRHYNFAVGVK
jgi:hypothetical protein